MHVACEATGCVQRFWSGASGAISRVWFGGLAAGVGIGSGEDSVNVLLRVIIFGRIVVFEILVAGTECRELVEQPRLAGELEAQHRPSIGVDAVAIGMLDDVTEQCSQHRRVLEVDELGWDRELGHAWSMPRIG